MNSECHTSLTSESHKNIPNAGGPLQNGNMQLNRQKLKF